MEHPGAAGSGEVEACRGRDVVEAEAKAIWNDLARIGSAYILNGVGRVTKWQPPGVVGIRVKSLWES